MRRPLRLERRVTLDVVRRQRLLEPVDVQPLELVNEVGRRALVPARRQVSRHAPPLVRVHHHVELGNGLAYRLDHREIDSPVARVQANLHRANACIAKSPASADAFVRVDELPGGRVCADAAARATEHAPDRLVASTGDEVPDRDLERPVAPVVEVDRLDDAVHRRGVSRVDPDQQLLEERPVREPVPARVALQTVIRADDDDRGVLVGARHGVPRGAERRVERIAVGPRLDRGDLHYSPP